MCRWVGCVSYSQILPQRLAIKLHKITCITGFLFLFFWWYCLIIWLLVAFSDNLIFIVLASLHYSIIYLLPPSVKTTPDTHPTHFPFQVTVSLVLTFTKAMLNMQSSCIPFTSYITILKVLTAWFQMKHSRIKKFKA